MFEGTHYLKLIIMINSHSVHSSEQVFFFLAGDLRLKVSDTGGCAVGDYGDDPGGLCFTTEAARTKCVS